MVAASDGLNLLGSGLVILIACLLLNRLMGLGRCGRCGKRDYKCKCRRSYYPNRGP
jgi:hypothetical protein